MSNTTETLRTIPLFRNITDEHLEDLVKAFTIEKHVAGATLFKQGERADFLYVLIDGSVELIESDATRFALQAPAPIGELGAITGRIRRMTAEVSSAATVWKISRDALMQFFEENGDVAFPIFFNLLEIMADKSTRDSRRMEEMRTNIIRTQKAMKRMRDLILETKETTLSETIHDTLQDLIGRNRKSNYVVTPPRSLPVSARLDDGTSVTVLRLSAVWLVISQNPSRESIVGEYWSGVLTASGADIPVSGTVREADSASVVIELDLLIEEYAEALEDYLTRVQMLDVIV